MREDNNSPDKTKTVKVIEVTADKKGRIIKKQVKKWMPKTFEAFFP
jgi:hypothetical protein